MQFVNIDVVANVIAAAVPIIVLFGEKGFIRKWYGQTMTLNVEDNGKSAP